MNWFKENYKKNQKKWYNAFALYWSDFYKKKQLLFAWMEKKISIDPSFVFQIKEEMMDQCSGSWLNKSPEW